MLHVLLLQCMLQPTAVKAPFVFVFFVIVGYINKINLNDFQMCLIFVEIWTPKSNIWGSASGEMRRNVTKHKKTKNESSQERMWEKRKVETKGKASVIPTPKHLFLHDLTWISRKGRGRRVCKASYHDHVTIKAVTFTSTLCSSCTDVTGCALCVLCRCSRYLLELAADTLSFSFTDSGQHAKTHILCVLSWHTKRMSLSLNLGRKKLVLFN